MGAWLAGQASLRETPDAARARLAEALGLSDDLVAAMLASTHLLGAAEDCQLLGPLGDGPGAYSTLFTAATEVWLDLGFIEQGVSAADSVDPRFVRAAAARPRAGSAAGGVTGDRASVTPSRAGRRGRGRGVSHLRRGSRRAPDQRGHARRARVDPVDGLEAGVLHPGPERGLGVGPTGGGAHREVDLVGRVA